MPTANMILNIILIAVSIVVVVSVLMQSSKSSGMGAAFGGETQALTQRGRAASREAKLMKITKTS